MAANNDELIAFLAEYSFDPYGFVLWAFPWGEPGELENFTGPEDWQVRILKDLGAGLLTTNEAIRLARTSGHGVGKSALVAWIIWWAISTMPDTIGVVTANTENQLRTKTWVQVAKWHRILIVKDMFRVTLTAIFSCDPAHETTWRVDMVPWSERNTEAFAGLHNKGKRVLLIFDEASAIPDLIWEVAEGALTDSETQVIWAVFGNPTRNKGRFRDCFPGGKFAHRWNTEAIDSRAVTLTNKAQINEWIEDYGVDSDFVRVRVLGKFPRVDSESFISYEAATAAVKRPQEMEEGGAVVLGVDVSRFGDDASVIFPRCGRDAISRPIRILRGYSTVQVAARVASECIALGAVMVFVDSGGVGGGVVDQLRALRIPVMEVDFGSKADGTNLNDGSNYANKRAEIWGAMRNWLATGTIPELKIDANVTLVDELCGPNYSLNAREEILLESKKDMRRRGVPSPNCADALACTFAMPIWSSPDPRDPINKPTVAQEWDPYNLERMYEDV